MEQDLSKAHKPPGGSANDRSDVDVRFVSGAAIGLIAVVAMTLIGLMGFLSSLERFATRQTAATNEPDAQQTPPSPRLQADPPIELAAFRNDEQTKLDSYGWTDREHQIARIPIDRAIHLLAERGFPEPAGPVELPTTREVKP